MTVFYIIPAIKKTVKWLYLSIHRTNNAYLWNIFAPQLTEIIVANLSDGCIIIVGGIKVKHEEISLNTKKALAGALKRAMSKKSFQKITVSELIADCGVNRKTFYYHFEDIYDLLHWMLEEESVEVVRNYDLLLDFEEAVTFVMNYVEENEHILNCAYDALGRDGLRRFFLNDFREICLTVIEEIEERTKITLEAGYREFLSDFYASAVSGILVEWLRDRSCRDRDAVMKYLTFAIRDSLAGIFGSSTNKSEQE